MRVSPLILEKLTNDKNFRLNTAIALGVSELNVKRLAKANSDNLTKAAAVIYYRKEGFNDEQIFEVETVAHQSLSNN